MAARAPARQTGVKLAVAVGAMVLAFVALVALANGLGGSATGSSSWRYRRSHGRRPSTDLSFQLILGTIFAPVMYLLNISWHEAQWPRAACSAPRWCSTSSSPSSISATMKGTLAPRTVAIITFALCGFANFSSIAIQMAVTGQPRPQPAPDDRQARHPRAGRGEPGQSDDRGAGGLAAAVTALISPAFGDAGAAFLIQPGFAGLAGEFVTGLIDQIDPRDERLPRPAFDDRGVAEREDVVVRAPDLDQIVIRIPRRDPVRGRIHHIVERAKGNDVAAVR